MLPKAPFYYYAVSYVLIGLAVYAVSAAPCRTGLRPIAHLNPL